MVDMRNLKEIDHLTRKLHHLEAKVDGTGNEGKRERISDQIESIKAQIENLKAEEQCPSLNGSGTTNHEDKGSRAGWQLDEEDSGLMFL